MGFALRAFKVESPRGIPAIVHPPRLERQVPPPTTVLLMMIGPRPTPEALH